MRADEPPIAGRLSGLHSAPVPGTCDTDSLVERKPRLGKYQSVNSRIARTRSLRTWGRQAVEDRGFRVLQVRQSEIALGNMLAFWISHAAIAERPQRSALSSFESCVATIGSTPERPRYAKRV